MIKCKANITCCQNCTERKLMCHATCGKYLKEREDYEKEKEERVKRKDLENAYTEFITGKRRRIRGGGRK